MLTLPLLKSLKAFINDVVMLAGGMGEPLPALITKTQDQVQWWNALNQASGGALNPSKCCCMVHAWEPDKFGILHPIPPPMDTVQIAIAQDPTAPKIPVLHLQEGT